MTKDQILQIVRERLRDRHPGGVTLTPLDRGIRREDGFWHVLVRPSEQPNHMYEYYDTLAEVETELSLQDRLKVVLVPTLPEE